MVGDTYEVGTKLLHVESGVFGEVIPNFKFPGDICVSWKNGLTTSYDREVLEETCEVVEES